jgi:hypothetical protein
MLVDDLKKIILKNILGHLFSGIRNLFSIKYYLVLIIIFTSVKFLFSYYFGDNTLDMEWKIIYENLVNSNSFSFHKINEYNVPSIYMPPLYAYFIYIFSFLGLSEFATVKTILFSQCLLSVFSAIFFFKILKIYYNRSISYYVSILYFLYPLNFYSASQISSISLQLFLFLGFCYYFLNSRNIKEFILLGFFAGLSILVRGEFWLLFIFSIMFKVVQNKYSIKKSLICLLTVFLLISPQVVRNYKIFDQVILTKSSGYNLWRGNSEELNVNGTNKENLKINLDIEKLKKKLTKEGTLEKYEYFLDNYYFNLAISNIKKDPIAHINHYFDKFFAFSIVNFKSDYPNYFNLIIIIPEIIISIFGLVGFILNFFSKKRNLELSILLSYYLIIIPVFFILPRYKLFILPLYFFFAVYISSFFFQKYFFKKTIK